MNNGHFWPFLVSERPVIVPEIVNLGAFSE